MRRDKKPVKVIKTETKKKVPRFIGNPRQLNFLTFQKIGSYWRGAPEPLPNQPLFKNQGETLKKIPPSKFPRAKKIRLHHFFSSPLLTNHSVSQYELHFGLSSIPKKARQASAPAFRFLIQPLRFSGLCTYQVVTKTCIS